MRDSYSILGLRRDAGAREVASEYRRLAREYHPDVSAASRDTVDLFLVVQEAYEILSDPQRRAAHDAELDRLEQRLRATVTQTRAPRAAPKVPPPPASAPQDSARVKVVSPPPFSPRSTTALATALAAAAILPVSLILGYTVTAAPRLVWAVAGSLLGLAGSIVARSVASGDAERLWRRTVSGGDSWLGGPEAARAVRRRVGLAASVSLLGRRLVLIGIPFLLILASR